MRPVRPPFCQGRSKVSTWMPKPMPCCMYVCSRSAYLRDTVLEIDGALEGVLLNIRRPHNISMVQTATWTLSNFCRGKPAPRCVATSLCR